MSDERESQEVFGMSELGELGCTPCHSCCDRMYGVWDCGLLKEAASPLCAVLRTTWYLTSAMAQVSIYVGAAAYVIPVCAASFLVSWKVLWKNVVFVLLAISSCVLPAIGVSFFSYEFPSIVGEPVPPTLSLPFFRGSHAQRRFRTFVLAVQVVLLVFLQPRCFVSSAWVFQR
jgi:hypothetical protein